MLVSKDQILLNQTNYIELKTIVQKIFHAFDHMSYHMLQIGNIFQLNHYATPFGTLPKSRTLTLSIQ